MKTAIGIAAFPLFCLLLSFSVLITDPAFTFLLLRETSPEESVPATRELFGFFAGKDDVPAAFNDAEKSHLADVRTLIYAAFILLAICSGALAYSIDKRNAARVVRGGSLALVIALLLAVIIPFDRLFTLFHLAFFPQGNWVFPPDSILIKFYPFDFFLKYAIWIAIHALVVSTISCLAIANRKKKA